MNKAQKIVLALGALLLLMVILFPPFKWVSGGRTFAASHNFIAAPPPPLELTVGTTPASVDVARWITHGLTLVLLTGLGLFLFRSWGASPAPHQSVSTDA